jgi:hypothetical protein
LTETRRRPLTEYPKDRQRRQRPRTSEDM